MGKEEFVDEGALKMNIVWYLLKRLILALICGVGAGVILSLLERANPEQFQCPVVVGAIIMIYVFFYEGKRR